MKLSPTSSFTSRSDEELLAIAQGRATTHVEIKPAASGEGKASMAKKRGQSAAKLRALRKQYGLGEFAPKRGSRRSRSKSKSNGAFFRAEQFGFSGM